MSKLDGIIETMARVMQGFEGGNPGDRNMRNNNPGNLVFVGQKGATGKDSGGFAIFATFEDGWNALLRQIKMGFDNTSHNFNSQMTLYQFYDKWANSSPEQERINYAESVASALGVDPNTTLEELKSL